MKNFTIAAVAIAIGLALSTIAMAKPMPKAEYKSGRDNIATEFRIAKAHCDLLRTRAKDICMARADGRKNVALAELAARYQPSQSARHDVRVAKAQAAYEVAREECHGLARKDNDVCVKNAEAARDDGAAVKAKTRTARTYQAFREKYAQLRAQRHNEIAGAR